MEKKVDIVEEKARAKQASPGGGREPFIRDAAWERERRWFEENKSLDPLALFAKYYSRF